MFTLADRVFGCGECGMVLDRDTNAAVNLATWGEQQYSQVPDPEARGRVTNAHRPERSGQDSRPGETVGDDVGTGYAPAA
jgi:putative transposase